MTLSLAERASELRRELAEKVLPYWFDTAQDREHGGYLLADDAVRGRGIAREKLLVTQSRMIWGFAHAHRKGFSTGERSYLAAAEQGHRFLLEHFLDRKRGGYFWTSDPSGRPIHEVKKLYGQAFVIYALVELHRAGGQTAPLEQALDLYRILQKRAHDQRHGGWLEHFTRDWRPTTKRTAGAEVEVPGLKSGSAHLHLMEAYAELYDATRDDNVKASLLEALEINRTQFFPELPGSSAFHRHPDWKMVLRPKSAGLCYAHNAEFAWLMLRVQQVLGVAPAWEHFAAILDHALRYGCDHLRGGFYSFGMDDQPATGTDKEWWAQAEMLAALTEGLQHEARADWSEALAKLIRFVWTHQVDPRDGIWLTSVTADGQPKDTSKAHAWKANYHDLRAIVKFIEAFGGSGRGSGPPPGGLERDFA